MWGCCRGLHGLARTSQDCPALLAYLTCPAHLKGQAKACCARPFDRPLRQAIMQAYCARPSAKPIVADPLRQAAFTAQADPSAKDEKTALMPLENTCKHRC